VSLACDDDLAHVSWNWLPLRPSCLCAFGFLGAEHSRLPLRLGTYGKACATELGLPLDVPEHMALPPRGQALRLPALPRTGQLSRVCNYSAWAVPPATS